MDRLTTDKDVSEMNMVELAHNSCYVKDHQAMFRSYDFDIDARNLTRKIIRDIAKCDDADLSDNDYFDEWISDFLSEGTDSIEGLIAVFYRNLWAMAELRERLKEYEDIGLFPEQIKEVDGLYAEKCKELAELQKSCPSGWEMAQIWAAMKHLKEYRELEEQEKLLKLPCKVGDTVWYINERLEKQGRKKVTVFFVDNGCVDHITLGDVMIPQIEVCNNTENSWITFDYKDDWNKTAFLTKEEAEDELKKMEESV